MEQNLSEMEKRRLQNLLYFERLAQKQGFTRIAGIDEAGRGPLAGPVVAAACILPEGASLPGINDSKQLLVSERAALFKKIVALPKVEYGIGIIEAFLIDQINILQATFQAMLAAIAALATPPYYLLVDGNRMPPTSIPGKAIVKGDSLSQSIAAASILAKETRDQLMQSYHQKWPEYRFDLHKGYATKKHLDALKKYGSCPIHRLSFAPLKQQNVQEVQPSFFSS